MELICGRTPNCGFRAHDRYFVEKPRFAVNICPRCNGPVEVVEDFTDRLVLGASVDPDPASRSYRQVVGI